MTYQTPKTWETGDFLNPANLNTYIRDQQDGLKSLIDGVSSTVGGFNLDLYRIVAAPANTLVPQEEVNADDVHADLGFRLSSPLAAAQVVLSGYGVDFELNASGTSAPVYFASGLMVDDVWMPGYVRTLLYEAQTIGGRAIGTRNEHSQGVFATALPAGAQTIRLAGYITSVTSFRIRYAAQRAHFWLLVL